MDTKLCRTCGRSGQNFVYIFKTDGLKNKIETCLPILVSEHCLLPDTLCPDCLTSIEHFYTFTKNCLQNIIILETQLDIQDSCLKAKRRKDKSCLVSLPSSTEPKCIQTEDFLNILLGDRKDIELFDTEFPLTSNFLNKQNHCAEGLVDYDINSNSNSSEEHDNSGHVIFGSKLRSLKVINDIIASLMSPKKGDDTLSNECLINEITERKNLQKRKSDSIESTSSKICRTESGNKKRKCSNPKKLEKNNVINCQVGEKKSCGLKLSQIKKEILESDDLEEETTNMDINKGSEDEQREKILHAMAQNCMLCNVRLVNPSALADHFMKCHMKEASQPSVESSNYCEIGESCDKKKRRCVPSLVKISDLRRSESFEDSPISDPQTEDDEAPPLSPNISCPNCPAVFSTKAELFVHLQLNHSEISTYLCGICMKQTNTASNLRNHVTSCLKARPIVNRYFCQVCCFGEDNYRTMESHVLVHNFLWKNCQKELKNFDPENYIEKNPNFVANGASPIKNFSCLECNRFDFDSFRKFSIHRRNVHSIFHCDLCSKFYGRNSHLWKHVNRLHKNHPSITCQMCFKTSASKYHLAQHFSKVHQAKGVVKKEEQYEDCGEKQDDKIDEFDMGNVAATFRKQESTDQENLNTSCDEENSLNQSSQSDNENSTDQNVAPKEIDPTHDLYANILTNYTPPKNEGDYKCSKCSKGFHKRMLLRKHKKNCRPKLQKDLLTRCKTCARIFKDRQSLAKHLTNYHSDYKCEICNENVPSKCEIVSHIRFQHPSCHLICGVCENILRCKKELLEHLSDHENSFVCQFCGDALASKVKLKMHILSLHRKILSLSCGICLKLFETQQVLRNHVTLIHKEQLVPLTSCPICGKNYGSKWKTFDHVNKSHGKFFRACKICLEIYETEAQLETHLKTVHNIQQVTLTNASKPHLYAPIKNEGPLVNLNNNIKANFDSDNEDNTEETENSQTSESEDDENSRPQEVAEEQKFRIAENAANFPTREDKMSLLEKRLLGKAFIQRDNNMTLAKSVTNHSYKLCLASSNPKSTDAGEYIQEKSTYPKIKREEENNFPVKKADSNSHHSKRTVYENSNDPSFCEICHKTWPAKKHLWQHYIRCHKRVAATVCGICLKTNDSYEALQNHLRETHPTLLHGQGFGSNFICRICGRYHNASSKLRLHMVIHEQFDWDLLEKFPPILKSNIKNYPKENGSGYIANGDEEKDEKYANILNENEEIYEAMIEQVEESTTSTDAGTGPKSQDSSSDSNDTKTASMQTNANKSEQPQSLSFSNLLQTLKNHNQFQVFNQLEQKAATSLPIDQSADRKLVHNAEYNVRAESVIRLSHGNVPPALNICGTKQLIEKLQDVKHSYLSEGSESSISDCEGEADEKSQSQPNGGICEHHDDHCENENRIVEDYDGRYYNRNIFRPKPEELNSAINSISDPCAEPKAKAEYDEFNESIQQGNSLNESEIARAVGSIL